jgi:SLT domain-containing protein
VAKYVPPNPLIALAIALGAAQAAIVAAQPIPYAKGTKNAKGGLSRVGEQGEEIMYVPNGTKVLPNKQTNRYGEVLDAMFDNRFDDFVNRKYIAPALMKEKARRETNQQKSFADNIVQSAMINPQSGLTYYDMEQLRKKGTRFEDESIEKLTDSLARKLSSSQSIYRS